MVGAVFKQNRDSVKKIGKGEGRKRLVNNVSQVTEEKKCFCTGG